MFIAIDTFLLEKVFEPFAHWFERKTGKTNFYLAWLAFGALFVSRSLDAFYSLQIGTDTFSALWSGIVLPIYATLLIQAQKSDERQQTQDVKVASPFLLGWGMFRLFFMMIGITGIISFLLDEPTPLKILNDPTFRLKFFQTVWPLALACGLYFVAVKRPPPQFKREPTGELKPVRIRS